MFIKRFFEDSKELLIKEYGAKKILYATVHMDEKTQHMHLKIIKLHYTPFLSF
ncbi:plasmid recombination protein [Staphylococcus capitis]|uniref:plasmid recombination protein n=1 Tax=Staphylococcus capitis TaxID=29388 RepID=UPI00198FA4A6|nr:plasmid recombination protein [Staphylococcus capitis]MBC3087794.1 plasmid recombination protein [Staphylococcus capitis]